MGRSAAGMAHAGYFQDASARGPRPDGGSPHGGAAAASEALRAAWRALAVEPARDPVRGGLRSPLARAARAGSRRQRRALRRPALTQPLGGLGDVLVSPLARWDAVWYLGVADSGYRERGLAPHRVLPALPAARARRRRAGGRVAGGGAGRLVRGVAGGAARWRSCCSTGSPRSSWGAGRRPGGAAALRVPGLAVPRRAVLGEPVPARPRSAPSTRPAPATGPGPGPLPRPRRPRAAPACSWRSRWCSSTSTARARTAPARRRSPVAAGSRRCGPCTRCAGRRLAAARAARPGGLRGLPRDRLRRPARVLVGPGVLGSRVRRAARGGMGRAGGRRRRRPPARFGLARARLLRAGRRRPVPRRGDQPDAVRLPRLRDRGRAWACCAGCRSPTAPTWSRRWRCRSAIRSSRSR